MQEIHFYKGTVEPTSATDGSIWFDKTKKTIKVKDTAWEEYGSGSIDISIPETPTDNASPSTKLFKTELDKKQDDIKLAINNKGCLYKTFTKPVNNSTFGDETVSSISFGARNFIEGSASFSTGNDNYLRGDSGITVGRYNYVSDTFGVAMGVCNSAAYSAIALGRACSALAEESVALGGSWYISDILLSGDANTLTYSYEPTEDSDITSLEKYLVVGNIIGYHIITAVDLTAKTITVNKTFDSENALTKVKKSINATIAKAPYSIAHRGIAEGYSSIAMGRGNNAVGNMSQAFGQFTITNNAYEFATGNYNKSNTGDAHTVFSIGNGTSETDRKNLVEVSSDGSVYYNGVGNYDGTNTTSASSVQQEITNLKSQVGKLEWQAWS